MIQNGDILLAVDTSTHAASVALFDGVNVRAEMTWESPRRHTTELTPRVVSMLEQLDVDGSSLSGLTVALGPGSFTGLRIGLALVKGLALSRNIPLVGIPTLDIAVYPVRRRRATLYATLQAGRGRICVAPYRWRRGGWRRIGEITITTWADFTDTMEEGGVFCGEIDADGLEKIQSRWPDAPIVPAAKRLRRAGYLAELGWERLLRKDHDPPATLQPLYLHTV